MLIVAILAMTMAVIVLTVVIDAGRQIWDEKADERAEFKAKQLEAIDLLRDGIAKRYHNSGRHRMTAI